MMEGFDRRIQDRRRSFARVLISVEGRVGYVADISEGGIRGLFAEPFATVPGQDYRLEVSFEELGIDSFSLEVAVRWWRIEEGALLVGFELLDSCPRNDAVNYELLRKYYMEAPGNILDSPPGGC
jgi:hypothetical protein